MSDPYDHLTENAVSDYDRLKGEATLLDLGRWSLLRLDGDDRKGWLQGQVTNDLRKFDNGFASNFCLCSSTGQVQAVVDAWAHDDAYWLTCETTTANAILQRVEEAVIMENVEISDQTPQMRMLSIQGPSATRLLSEIVPLPSLDVALVNAEGVNFRVFRSHRTAFGGWDLWIPAESTALIEKIRDKIPPMDESAYEVARLEAGVPKAGVDYTEKTLPPELGSAFTGRYISYTKGCYTGQEVLMRIYSRGHTNKSWVGLLADAPLEVGAPISHGTKGEIGTITSQGFSPDFGPIAAAIIRNEFAEEREELTVTTSLGPIAAEVKRMPLLRLG